MIGHSLIDIVRSKTGTRLLDPALAFSISNFSVSFDNKSAKYIAPISPGARARATAEKVLAVIFKVELQMTKLLASFFLPPLFVISFRISPIALRC